MNEQNMVCWTARWVRKSRAQSSTVRGASTWQTHGETESEDVGVDAEGANNCGVANASFMGADWIGTGCETDGGGEKGQSIKRKGRRFRGNQMVEIACGANAFRCKSSNHIC